MSNQQADVPLLKILCHSDKLIPACPKNVIRPRAFHEDPCRILDQDVASMMSLGIVRILQSIQIDRDHTKHTIPLPCLNPPFQCPAVSCTGHRVNRALLLQRTQNISVANHHCNEIGQCRIRNGSSPEAFF